MNTFFLSIALFAIVHCTTEYKMAKDNSSVEGAQKACEHLGDGFGLARFDSDALEFLENNGNNHFFSAIVDKVDVEETAAGITANGVSVSDKAWLIWDGGEDGLKQLKGGKVSTYGSRSYGQALCRREK